MNNCDLEKLCIPGVKLEPPFKPDITKYKATVPSQLTQIKVDAFTSDTGASSSLLGGDGSRVVMLKDGINHIIIEVTAEDGTVKKYSLEVTKLSASNALLQGITLSEDLQLVPPFASNVYEYSCIVPYFQSNISIHPVVPDSKMKVTVNGKDDIKSFDFALGDTLIEVQVTSADGTKSQVYSIIITRSQLPCCVRFAHVQDQIIYECPVSLTAFYRPVSIHGSDPKHILSAPYMDLLTRRSKTDPLDESPLKENWRCPEYELDMKMTSADVHCCYAYLGCDSVLKLSELGHHVKDCSFKPPNNLDPKDVTDKEWYKTEYSSTKKTVLEHTIKERGWEKKLQQVYADIKPDKVCRDAEAQICLYKDRLPKTGIMPHYSEGMSPLDALHQATILYASAIKHKPRDPNFHFQLGMVLEEHYYAAEIYGLKKKTEEVAPELSSAKATGKNEEILAICRLHGFTGRPGIEQQLKALDLEYHQLKDQGQSGRADYIQNLYAWKSKEAGKIGVLTLDEENPLTQAFLKYQDALSLNGDNWQYNFHVGRLLLLQKKNKEALLYLQNALALRPASPVTRLYVGLALAEQESGPGARTQEAVIYLQQGLEKLLSDFLTAPESSNLLQADNSLSLLNVHLLRGFLQLGKLLKNIPKQPSSHMMPSQQVLHFVVDWSAKAMIQCPHRGEVAKEIEWILLEGYFCLLESLVQDVSSKEDWVLKRSQALSALIRLSSIPECKELLDIQEKVCQLGVIVSPCNSYSLYLLGVAQLAHYDNRPSSEDGLLALEEAKLSFKASIKLENMPTKGPPPPELTNQRWWQQRKAAEELKNQKQATKAATTAPATIGAAAKGRGATPVSRGANGASKPIPTAKRASIIPGGTNNKAGTPGAASNKAIAASTARGRGTATLSPSKTVLVGASKAKTTSPAKLTQATQAQTSAAEKHTETEAKPEAILDSGPVCLNRGSFLHRLGLARALSRTNETAAEASAIYQEVIKMAPQADDAYIELAELLLKTDPLAAVDVYCQYPQKTVQTQSFDDAFIPGEIIRLLIKYEKYDDPRLPVNMISYGKVMGIGSLEKYISILEEKFKTGLLKTVYAGIHNKPVDDKELQNFFRFKCWI
ncbi:uncharacterized protein O3C94_003849 [Discoglossus pictus]